MKTILTGLLVLAFAISLKAQDFPRTCGTEMPPRPKYGAGQTNNLVPSLMHNPCLHKSFSIAFFVVLDSNYAWETGLPGATLTPMHIAASIASLNATFGGLCVTFSACVTNTIANYNYNKWKQTSTETEVTDNWYEPKTLNVYLVGGVITPPGPAYTYFPGTGKDILVISKESFRTSPKIFMHQVGHFFGLPDTYAEIGNPVSPGPPPLVTSYEYVARTNCYTNGDGFCDTEADCYPFGMMIMPPYLCPYIQYGLQDGNNDYYTPPSDNYMSNFPCACRFTQEQMNFMANVMMTSRAYLH